MLLEALEARGLVLHHQRQALDRDAHGGRDVVPVVDPQREVAEVHRLVHMRDARRGRHGGPVASARARKTREI
jgi:hypothetical protein